MNSGDGPPLTIRKRNSRARQLNGLVGLVYTALAVVPVAALLGLGATLAARVFVSQAPTTATGLAQVTLTDEVRWPFFDVVVIEVANLAESQEFQQAVEQAYPDETFEMTSEVPTTVDAVIDIEVIAEDADTAREIARSAGSWLVDQHEGSRIETLERRLDRSRDELETTNELRDTAVRQAQTLVQARAADVDGVQAARLDREIDEANRAVLHYNDTILELEASIRDQEIGLELVAPEISVARVQATSSEPGESSLPVQAGVAVFLLSGIVLAIVKRQHGRILSDDQVEAVLGMPVSPYSSADQNVHLARVLSHSRSSRGFSVIGVESALPGSIAPTLAANLAGLGLPVESSARGLDEGDGDDRIHLRPVAPKPPLAGDAKALLECDAVLVVADPQNDRLMQIRRRLNRFRDQGIPVLAVVVDRSPYG